MKLREWLKEMEYELLQGNLDEEVDDVVYDSRKAAAGSVFVCMRGANVDSHKFIPDVIQKGAKVLVTEEAVTVPEEITVLRVGNGRNALSLLSAARFGYPARKMTTIGVTGTKGKTTTTYMIKAILEAAGEKTGLIGTNGAIIGSDHFPTMNTTPESYILQEYFAKMVEQGCRYMVMEVSSQSYLMHRVDGIFFDYSIFLNISNDHIGPNEHASFEEYLYYKKLLLQNSRVCLVNRDDGHYREIIEGAKAEIKTFSMEHSADFRAADGKYIRELGLSKERVAHALEHMQVDGRMEIVYKSAKCTVIVDYAHNAVSMESLLMTLRDYKPKRLVVVFGCGGNRARDRRYSMGEIGGKLADLSIITADNSRFEKTSDILADIKTGLSRTEGKFIEIPDRREAIEYSLSHAQEGDIIAIIGKGHEDYQEIEGVRHPFLDRTVVQEAVQKLGM